MLRFLICIGLLIATEIISAQHSARQDVPSRATGRLGFSFLEQIRQFYCQSFCKSSDTMPYFANVICAAKCPELYLPHGTTTVSTPTTTTQNTTSNGTQAAETTPKMDTMPNEASSV